MEYISKAARRLDVSVDWLRKAERDGRIPLAKRHMCNWRVYSEEDIETLKKLLVPKVGETPNAAG